MHVVVVMIAITLVNSFLFQLQESEINIYYIFNYFKDLLSGYLKVE